MPGKGPRIAGVHRCGKGLPWWPVIKTSPSNAGGASSIPGGGARIPHASWAKSQSMKHMQYCNKFSKAFKVVHIRKTKQNNPLRPVGTGEGFVSQRRLQYPHHGGRFQVFPHSHCQWDSHTAFTFYKIEVDSEASRQCSLRVWGCDQSLSCC